MPTTLLQAYSTLLIEPPLPDAFLRRRFQFNSAPAPAPAPEEEAEDEPEAEPDVLSSKLQGRAHAHSPQEHTDRADGIGSRTESHRL